MLRAKQIVRRHRLRGLRTLAGYTKPSYHSQEVEKRSESDKFEKLSRDSNGIRFFDVA
ncbi:MAG TPA: hypothetical protein VEN30_00025 [Paraburkholderia sp.]|nr:hypothetical protein [Paraburkholderia sp.]